MLTLIQSLPQHLFRPCSVSLFPPSPGKISYCPPIFHPLTLLLSIFVPASSPYHFAGMRSTRLPVQRPHPPASTPRLRFPLILGGPRSSLRKPVSAFPHPGAPPLSSLTFSKVPVLPRGFPIKGYLPPSACLHHPHARSPPCHPRPAAQSPASPKWFALCSFVPPSCVHPPRPPRVPRRLLVSSGVWSLFRCPFALRPEAW